MPSLNKALASEDEIIPAGGDHRGGVFDMFAVGSKRVMDYYHDLHRLIPKYYSEGVAMHSELLLRIWLERGGTKNNPTGSVNRVHKTIQPETGV